MTVGRKDFMNRIMVDHKTDLINYPYFIFLKIRKLDPQFKKFGKKTQIVNIYDN